MTRLRAGCARSRTICLWRRGRCTCRSPVFMRNVPPSRVSPFRSLLWPSPRFASLPSSLCFPSRPSPRMASCRWRRARARSNAGHGDGPQAWHAARTDNRRRVRCAGRRIWLADLPPLRHLQPRDLSRAEEGLHRHRQGPIHLREFSRNSLDVAAFLLARCVGDDKAFAAVELLFSQQDKWAFVDKPLEPLIAAMRPAGLTHDQAMACLKDQAKADAMLAIEKRRPTRSR